MINKIRDWYEMTRLYIHNLRTYHSILTNYNVDDVEDSTFKFLKLTLDDVLKELPKNPYSTLHYDKSNERKNIKIILELLKRYNEESYRNYDITVKINKDSSWTILTKKIGSEVPNLTSNKSVREYKVQETYYRPYLYKLLQKHLHKVWV